MFYFKNTKSHYHHCPSCYEKCLCDLDCTIEPDLEDDGKEFGAHCICDSCIANELTKEWWDRYNGFIK